MPPRGRSRPVSRAGLVVLLVRSRVGLAIVGDALRRRRRNVARRPHDVRAHTRDVPPCRIVPRLLVVAIVGASRRPHDARGLAPTTAASWSPSTCASGGAVAATPRRTHARTRNAGEVPRRPRRRRGRVSRSADPVTCAFGPTLPRRRPRDAPAFGATPPPSSAYSAGASLLVCALAAARRCAVTRPPTRAPARDRSAPSAVTGPVLRPPWSLHRPPRPLPGASQVLPARGPRHLAPHRGASWWRRRGVVGAAAGSRSGRRCSMR